jgi:hypothetical protein
MSSLGVVSQPVINNTTGVSDGSLTLTSEITDVSGSVTLTPSEPASANANGSFISVSFTTSSYYLATRCDAVAGDFFLIKNTGAISGTVRLYHGTGGTSGSSINGIPTSTNGDYIDFALSTGKKLAVYCKTVKKLSVSYV